MSTTIITTTTVTLEPTLECEYAPLTTWTTSGTESEFGRGTTDITVNTSGLSNAVLLMNITGDASIIDKIEYDSNIGNTRLYQWKDSESNSHQVTTGITETTLENGDTRVSIDISETLPEEIEELVTLTTTSTDTERELSNLRVYDSNGNALNMETVTTETTTTVVSIAPFELPRDDWYDSDGRLYKDAIIENLNAIEDKLNELAAINAFEAETPDVSTLSLEDVTLASDDNKIVNLKSLVDILGLINYPMELEFAGTKISKISYYNSSYEYTTRKNITTNLTSENNFLFYNFSNNTVRVSSSASIGTNESLLACYVDGRVINMFTPFFAGLNLMYLLSNMNKSTLDFTVGHGTSKFYFASGQQAASGSAESKGGSVSNTAHEEGR